MEDTRVDEKRQQKIEKGIRHCTWQAKALSTNVKVRKPTVLQTLQRNRYQIRSVYYLTSEREIKEDVYNEEKKKKKSPYSYPKRGSDFSYRTKYREDHAELRKRAKQYEYYNRPNYRSRLNESKLERLHIPLSDIELPGQAVTDEADPEYFTLVSGKPISEPTDIKNYIQDLQSLFLINLQTGYRYDQTYLMVAQNTEEKKRLADIRKRFNNYAECYDKFLAEDHSSSLRLLKTADEESKNTKMKREMIKRIGRDCGWYRTKILILDEKWRIARVFQKFLYQISPLWWRKEYDFIHKNKETGDLMTSKMSLFNRTGGASLTTVPSIITIIDQFIDEVGKSEVPRLYFEDPTELLQIFSELERNNLLALLQCEELSQPAQQMIEGLEKARQLFKQEVNVLQDHLKILEEEVIFEENRSKECEEKAKAISLGLFRDLIVDKYTLNLYVNVEDCFQVCVAPNDSNLTLLMMMKGIEYEQESLMVALDNLPNDIVLKALHTCYKEDAKIMKEAQEATKMIIQIETLLKTLRKSFEPKREVRRLRKLVWRSEPPVEKMEMKMQAKALTKEQLDYLYYFTDFCPTTDDPEIGKMLYSQKKININI